MGIIQDKVPLTERLAGLAEEATELAQAALKYRRALDKTNPTPVDEDTAYERLLEELADVMVYTSTFPINMQYVTEMAFEKTERWKSRLSE